MGAKIEINDGNPWWVSLAIWVVPGPDPNGSAGMPMAGQDNYVWAQVHNTGDVPVEGIQLHFYWSNPATGVLRSNSQLIGTGFADLEPGETKEVLCIAPWRPIIVNNGHECLVVEALTTADPLPFPLPDAFDPPTYHQVAQRNLQVVILSAKTVQLTLPIQLSASPRRGKAVRITLDKARDGQELAAQWLRRWDERPLPYNDELVRYTFKEEPGCEQRVAERSVHSQALEVEPGQAKAVYLQLELAEASSPGMQVLHIQELEGDTVVGGNSILILSNP